MEILERFHSFCRWAESISDPRVANWLFVPSIYPTYSMVIFYVIFSVWLGPKLMQSRNAIDLRLTLILYNAAMTILNFHIFKELVLGAIDAGFSFPCEPLNLTDDPKHIRIASAIWWYFISKLIELLDTVFFVLRKKQDQITFLHIYHHATMPCLWWIGMKWVAGGTSTYAAAYNSLVHVIMYTYYGIAACGPKYQKYLWWKKYLTQLQLVQFCVAVVHSMYNSYTDCPFPRWMYTCLDFYMVTFLLLFGNFYIQAYIKRRRLASKTDDKRNLKQKEARLMYSHSDNLKQD